MCGGWLVSAKMIDKNLPEPPLEGRRCVGCQRPYRNTHRAMLLHWPSEDCTKKKVKLFASKFEIEPFSHWFYECQYCRGWETRRRKAR